MKSNKIVQYPMEGFDPSAFLAKPFADTTATESTVTTLTVKSLEGHEADEETGERREPNCIHRSEVKLFEHVRLKRWTKLLSSLVVRPDGRLKVYD